MVDGDGIIELVGPLAEHGIVAVKPAQDEIFVEIGDVGDFPAQRVDGGQPGAHELLVVQVADQFQGPLAGVLHGLDQICGTDGRGHGEMPGLENTGLENTGED